ncbi:MAG: choice-of-anchor Q domain-containing protein, partial [Kiritimatiellia bacterium]
ALKDSVLVSNCLITGNSSSGNGGGARWITMTDCDVVGNVAADGGGIDLTIARNCKIFGNYATNRGGGVRLSQVLNSIICSNNAGIEGGGGYGGTLSNCWVQYNASVSGGGMRAGLLYNCLFVGNSAGSRGAVYGDSAGICFNCTVIGNFATNYNGAGRHNFINCIIYSNNAPANPNWEPGSTFTNSCTWPEQSGWAAGNTTNYPMFLNPGAGYGANHEGGDYHLQPGSPCLNAGTNEPWMAGALDLNGRSRIDRFARRVDMGCYEYVPVGSLYQLR